MSEFRTNMSESQLLEMLIDCKKHCEECRHVCKCLETVPICDRCETDFWIRELTKHFTKQAMA